MNQGVTRNQKKKGNTNSKKSCAKPNNKGLRIKYLRNISDEDIVGLNLPTAVPYVFDFDNDLRLINDYFLGDPEEIKKLMEAVAKQGQKK